ncbi:YebC/PmpR family DNA-binding transcriptional regulator [Umboniibacter marinipuniceus]|uniref:Probable transcriptional regulatory protein DFR27_1698 n=1 Tax=Umboniibacter marinipuniceus TaxID=569599 RepID=A0A3M0A6V0_9GAMM|nr:YebC/PmpR family DNA-binding transcriptional regulator [Umboniibacter marinipuniceus]RMA79259.1 YebC/PmpR family DNA-binding regulatory protein [Umboniibacter marinipuniceus]
MAGHSKWANIRHRKAAQDAKRGKVFTKLIRELVVAARSGGPIPDDNPRLRAAVDKALGANMKRDTIDKAIARGAGNAEGDNYDEIRYEGYAPGGVAVLVETMTDNRNRTVAEVRHCFSKRGGSLGTDGSVAYLFSRQGKIWVASTDEDSVMELAIEHGAEDVQLVDDAIEVSCDWTDIHAVREGLVSAGLTVDSADVEMVPATQVALDPEAAEKVLALIDALEDLDDVQNVYSNADFSQLADS